MHVRILANRTRTNAHVRVRVRFEFWQNAHVRAMCVRPKIECANVRARQKIVATHSLNLYL